jgi:hypothetical protein
MKEVLKVIIEGGGGHLNIKPAVEGASCCVPLVLYEALVYHLSDCRVV